EMEIKDVAFETLLNELQGGTIDMVIAAMNPDDQRIQQADASDPYYSEVDQMLVIRVDDAEKFKGADDFEGAKVAVQTGTIFPDVATENLPGCETLLLQAVPDIFNNLLNGKCDAALVDGNAGQGYIDANDGLVAVEIDFPVVDGMAVWVQKGDPNGYMEQINKTIAEITEKGLYEQWLADATTASEE
ncbi:MAG: transporter substrate-binding domain-containing protein, partial [Clostridia bacterium]|nr:transporter substrate-binding domain-containing protein [Clostridia bacterium]